MEFNKGFWSISTEPTAITDKEVRDAYSVIYPYVRDFLCAKHPYRKGAVCPFVPAAIKNDNIYFYYLKETNVDIVVAFLREAVDMYCKIREKKGRNYISLILMFPESYSIEKISQIHYYSKIFCIDNYIMIGATFRDNNATSLHNDDFFPLRTLVPCLILRDLTIHDLLFLDPEHYSVDKRINFLSKFIERFDVGTDSKNKEELATARELLFKYQQGNG